MTDATFQAALQRARAREAADIEAARNGQQPKSVDLYAMLDKLAQERMQKAFA